MSTYTIYGYYKNIQYYKYKYRYMFLMLKYCGQNTSTD